MVKIFSAQNHLIYTAWPWDKERRNINYTPFLYIFRTKTRGGMTNFHRIISNYRSSKYWLIDLTFFCASDNLETKSEKKTSVLFPEEAQECEIVQLLICLSTGDSSLTMWRWLYCESHSHTTQPTNQNMGMHSYTKLYAD